MPDSPSSPKNIQAAAEELRRTDDGAWRTWLAMFGTAESANDASGSTPRALLAIALARMVLRVLTPSPQRLALLDRVLVPQVRDQILRQSNGFSQRWNTSIPDRVLFDNDPPELRALYDQAFGGLASFMLSPEAISGDLSPGAIAGGLSPDALSDDAGLGGLGIRGVGAGSGGGSGAGAGAGMGSRSMRAKPEPTVSRQLAKGAKDEGDFVRLKIWYGTTRKSVGGTDWNAFYSGERAAKSRLQLGSCEVSIPAEHRYGKQERPHWWHFEFKENPEKHVVLLGISPLDKKKFIKSVREAEGESALVFVHGFNVPFDGAARQMAQLTYDLQFTGVPFLFSWPARGEVAAYKIDEASMEGSVARLREFLDLVSGSFGFKRVHLLAHSMGSRCLVRAAVMAAAGGSTSNWRQLVLTAPDVDQDELASAVDQLAKATKRVTLYASSNDLAMVASRKFHAAPRAGESGDHVLVVRGMDTVDVSRLNTSLLGHSYHADNDSVVSDLVAVVNLELPPKKRPRLEELTGATGHFWRFA